MSSDSSDFESLIRELWAKQVGTCSAAVLRNSVEGSEIVIPEGLLTEDEKHFALSLSDKPSRREEWIAGRKALFEARQLLSMKGFSATEGVSVSLSHTRWEGRLWVLAVAVPRSVGSVGVDLESVTRQVSDSVYRRITDDQERRMFPHYGALDFWAIKEACFKADPDNSGKVAWAYRCIAPGRARGADHQEFSFQALRSQDWVVALAHRSPSR